MSFQKPTVTIEGNLAAANDDDSESSDDEEEDQQEVTGNDNGEFRRTNRAVLDDDEEELEVFVEKQETIKSPPSKPKKPLTVDTSPTAASSGSALTKKASKSKMVGDKDSPRTAKGQEKSLVALMQASVNEVLKSQGNEQEASAVPAFGTPTAASSQSQQLNASGRFIALIGRTCMHFIALCAWIVRLVCPFRCSGSTRCESYV